MKHLCIFCGQRANSSEHVWPGWLARIIEQLPGKNKTLSSIRTNQHGERRGWKKDRPEIITKNVCKVGCNGGWMSDLESEAASIIRPMVNGEEQTLTGKQQATITIWMIKTAMVLDSMSSETTFYEGSERFHFRNTFLPPGYLSFWLGHYSGSYWSGFTNHRILRNEQCIPQIRSFVLTMSFGPLVLQVCNTKLATSAIAMEFPFVKKREWSTVELVYPFLNSVQWPPPGLSFNDSQRTLLAFSERFGGYT
jgi:hypothetical protein